MKGKYTQNSLKRGGYWAVIACRLPYKEEKNINVEGISWR